MRFRFIACVMLIFSCLYNPVYARTIYVSQKPIPLISGELLFDTISKAVDIAKAGDTVRISSGIYREKVVINNSGTQQSPIIFESAPGADVVVTGADVTTGWVKEDEGNVYSIDWPHNFIGWSPNNSHGAPPPIGRAEQFFISGYPMHQVLERNQLSPGAFYVDLLNKKLYIIPIFNNDATNIDSVVIEGSVRDCIWHVKGDHVKTKGLKFRYAANPAQFGAVTISGNYNIIEDCVMEKTNGEGARFEGKKIFVKRCVIQDNGMSGFSGCRSHDLMLSHCVVRNNNIKNFDRGWGGCGAKIVLSRNVIINKCQFIENRGVGLWFDIGDEDCDVRSNLFLNNENAGLFYEISYGLLARNNVFIGNGFAATGGSWGVDSAISISSSPGCIIENNLIVGNNEGLSFREQLRTTPTIDGDIKEEKPIWNHNEEIRNNVFAYNGTQIWGWFAIDDERHWPKSMQEHKSVAVAGPENDIAADYISKTKDGQPKDLSLEDLDIKIYDNLFCVDKGQSLFNWGPRWSRNRFYSNTDDIQKELGFKIGRKLAELRFYDISAKDLRVSRDDSVIKLKCYPLGSVPGVELGVYD